MFLELVTCWMNKLKNRLQVFPDIFKWSLSIVEYNIIHEYCIYNILTAHSSTSNFSFVLKTHSQINDIFFLWLLHMCVCFFVCVYCV